MLAVLTYRTWQSIAKEILKDKTALASWSPELCWLAGQLTDAAGRQQAWHCPPILSPACHEAEHRYMLMAALQACQEFVSCRTSLHGAPWKGFLQEATCRSKQGLALLLLLEVKC